ncbi:MAG TPA: hypothetical protein VKQ71_08215 [Acidimicrobiales bacterium]|nr:hypothetical protein [Acidimicrobiales bacterium]
MPPVDTLVPLYVGTTSVPVTVRNDGNVSIYYQVETSGGTTISTLVNDGTVGAGNALALVAPTFFLASGPGAQVSLIYGAPVATYAGGLIVNGQPVDASLFAQITGSAGDDSKAISLGTNQPLPVEQVTIGTVGATTGAIQLNLGTSTCVFYEPVTLTGTVTFSVVSANESNMWIMLISAAGHTINWFTGTQWPNGVPPTPSGGKDKYTFIVAAATNGVPTVIEGSFEQALA